MMNWFRRLMYGRYGGDPLNSALLVLCIVLMLISILTHLAILSWLGSALLLLCYFRMFSRNIQARYAENQRFLKWWQPITNKLGNKRAQFADRKTHRYLKCPNCAATLRVPRGKGRINVTCPKCKRQFEAKS